MGDHKHFRERVGAGIEGLDRRLGTHVWIGMTTGIRLAQILGKGTGRIRMIWVGMLFSTGRYKGPARVKLPFRGTSTTMVLPDLAAFRVLREIFFEDQYRCEPGPDPATILDLGANIGASAFHYRRNYPDARIVCVEADPALIEVLKENTDALDVEVVHAAVAGSSGEIEFFASDQSWDGSIVGGRGEPVTVPAVTLDDLIAEYEPDLIKIDIEGAEYAVLAASRLAGQARVIVGEIHSPVAEERTQDVLNAFKGFTLDTDSSSECTLFRAVRHDTSVHEVPDT